MALRVWLPLNGTLDNIGISDVTVTNNGATVDNNGKIGKCYYFNRSITNYLKIDNPFQLSSINKFSMSFWIKIPSNASGNNQIIHIGNGAGWNNNRFTCFIYQSSSSLVFSCGDGTDSSATHSTQYSCKSSSLVLNEWTHVACTYSTGVMKLYLNGVLNVEYTTSIIPSFANVPYIGIGAGPNAGEPATIYVNDARIYDHCLSAKEVKEISQGLVLHYKLDGFNGGVGENILSNTSFETQYTQSSGWDTSKNGTLLASSWGGYNSGVGNQATVYHAHLKDFNNEWVYEYHKTADETWLGISQGGLQTKLKAGETYTFSWEEYHVEGTNRVGTGLYYFKTDATSANFHLGIQQAETITRLNNQWQKFTYTFIAPTDADWSKNMSWYIYGHYNGNGIFYMRNPKLEKGSTATAWSSTPTEIGVDTTKITDSSGYGHDGTILGAPTAFSDAERYNVSMLFDGVDDGIQVESADLPAVLNNACTISFWMKSTGENGGRSIYFSAYNASPFWCIEKSASNQFRYDWNGSPDQYNGTITDNVWTYICLCRDSTASARLYINGQLNNTFTTATTSLALGNIWRIARDVRTGDGTPYHGLMSDFRIYATALSAEDILDLYHTPANIDNLQNIHAFELKEQSGNLFAGSPMTGTMTWDATNNYYTITSNPNTSTWGIGPAVGTSPKKIIPWGMSYILTYEVYSPTAAQWYIDYNNNDPTTSLSGNDNDNGRLRTGVNVPANTWTLITYGCSNTNETKNPGHLPLYDYSTGLGPVMTNISSAITWHMRNPQWYLVDADNKEHIYESGVFQANFIKEDNQSLYTSFRNEEKAAWAHGYIEK